MTDCSNFYTILILFALSIAISGISTFTPLWYKEAGAYYGIVTHQNDQDNLNGYQWLFATEILMLIAFSIHVLMIPVLLYAFSKYRFEGLKRSNRWLFVTISVTFPAITVLEVCALVAFVIFICHAQESGDSFYHFKMSVDPFLAFVSVLLTGIATGLSRYIAKKECVSNN